MAEDDKDIEAILTENYRLRDEAAKLKEELQSLRGYIDDSTLPLPENSLDTFYHLFLSYQSHFSGKEDVLEGKNKSALAGLNGAELEEQIKKTDVLWLGTFLREDANNYSLRVTLPLQEGSTKSHEVLSRDNLFSKVDSAINKKFKQSVEEQYVVLIYDATFQKSKYSQAQVAGIMRSLGEGEDSLSKTALKEVGMRVRIRPDYNLSSLLGVKEKTQPLTQTPGVEEKTQLPTQTQTSSGLDGKIIEYVKHDPGANRPKIYGGIGGENSGIDVIALTYRLTKLVGKKLPEGTLRRKGTKRTTKYWVDGYPIVDKVQTTDKPALDESQFYDRLSVEESANLNLEIIRIVAENQNIDMPGIYGKLIRKPRKLNTLSCHIGELVGKETKLGTLHKRGVKNRPEYWVEGYSPAANLQQTQEPNMPVSKVQVVQGAQFYDRLTGEKSAKENLEIIRVVGENQYINMPNIYKKLTRKPRKKHNLTTRLATLLGKKTEIGTLRKRGKLSGTEYWVDDYRLPVNVQKTKPVYEAPKTAETHKPIAEEPKPTTYEPPGLIDGLKLLMRFDFQLEDNERELFERKWSEYYDICQGDGVLATQKLYTEVLPQEAFKSGPSSALSQIRQRDFGRKLEKAVPNGRCVDISKLVANVKLNNRS